MKKMLTASLVLVAALFAAGNVAAKSTKEISPYPLGERSVFSDRATAERIKPVGSVCVEGEECGTAAAAGEEVASGPRSGEEVYNASCNACHGAGVAGAPKPVMGFCSRIAQGEATLVKHAIEGLNAMPPKGMCMTCSDDEIKAAVEFMVEKSK